MRKRIIFLISLFVCVFTFIMVYAFRTDSIRKSDSDELMALLRYENSSDLVRELDGLEVGKIYTILGKNGKVTEIRVAQLDRKWRKVVVIILSGTQEVKSTNKDEIGYKMYTPESMANINIDVLKERIHAYKEKLNE